MRLTALYHDLRSLRRESRLRRLIARLALAIDPADPHEREIAAGLARWAAGQERAADRAAANAARAAGGDA